jgi:hypothetical protein
MVISRWRLLVLGLVFVGACLGAAAQRKPLEPVDGKIGIFDLRQIRAVPLEPEILSKTEDGTVITEEFRITGRPGVRVFGYLSYPKGAKGCPCNVLVRYTGAESRKSDAKNGFVGISISAPDGNTDPKKKASLGGPLFKQDFKDDPEQSWIYHHVVALIRTLDYLETRPEVNMQKVVVMGFSWAGYITALLHALDNRPCAYISWHGTGYFADAKGLSGDKPSLISRKHYEMYAPSAYARYGAQPLFVGTAITDYFATLDGLICMWEELRCPKGLSVAPNRYHASTSRDEFRGSGSWAWHWQGDGPALPTVTDGSVSVRDKRLIYTFACTTAEPPTYVEVLYSYGAPGHWTGRTWHRKAAVKTATGYECELPVYDPAVPLYALAQVETKTLGAWANTPQAVAPMKLGITAATATYSKLLYNFEDKSDLYIPAGTPTFIPDAPEGQTAASIAPFHDGTVHLLNLEPYFWKDAKELRFFLKGDGQPGPINVYVVTDTNYWLDHERKNYTKFTLVGADEAFAPTWKEYVIPLKKVANLDRVDCLFFEVGTRPLLIDAVRVQ